MNSENQHQRAKGVFLIFFVIFLAITVAFITLKTDNKRRVLFFYNDVKNKDVGIALTLKQQASPEEEIRATLNFLLYPPQNSTEYRAILGGTSKINMLFLKDKICYIDITVKNPTELSYMAKSLSLIRKTVLFNFSYIEETVITINGQEA